MFFLLYEYILSFLDPKLSRIPNYQSITHTHTKSYLHVTETFLERNIL